jgi:tetratricopeptide (TPR) repeat protein
MEKILKSLKNLKTSHLLFGFFALALALRIIYYLQIRNNLLFQTLLFDARYYHEWAKFILTRGWFSTRNIFFVSPLYANFLAFIYKIGGSPQSVKFIQFGLGSLIPVFIYCLGQRLFSKRVGIIAGLISCFWGPAIFFDGLLLKTSLEVFLGCASLLLLIIAKDKKQNSFWLIPGIVMGLSTLAKDTTLVLIPLVVVWMYLSRASLVKPLKSILFFLLGAGLIIGTLTIRNIVVAKDFVLTTYGGGINFYMGNFRGADGGLKEPDFIRIDPFYEEIDSRREAENRAGRALKASEISAFWLKAGFKEIKADPRNFLRLLMRKTGLLFNKTGLSDNYQMAYFQRESPLLRHVLIGFWPVAILGLSGILLSFWLLKRPRDYSLLMMFFFATSILLVLGHIIDRYREALVPILILFSAYLLDQIYLNIKEKKFGFVAICAVTILIFTGLTSLHFPNFEQKPFADVYNQMGLLYHEKADFALAATEYRKAIFERENHLWARQNLADAYLRMGNVNEAIVEYKKAIQYRPDVLELYVLLKKATQMKGLSKEEINKRLAESQPQKSQMIYEAGINSASYSVGLEYLMRKEYAKGIAEFQKVLDAYPDAVNALINIGIAYRATDQPEKAIASYERALKVAPEIIPARYNLAMILMSKGRFKEAVPHLEEIVSVFPEYLLSQYYLAKAYEETGEISKALEQYKSIVESAKKDPQRRRLAAQIEDKIWLLEKQIKGTKQSEIQSPLLEKADYE